MGKVLSPENEQFILDNYLKLSGKQMADQFGCSSTAVYRFMRIKGLIVPKELSRKFASSQLIGRTVVTPEQDEQIKKLYLEVPIKRLAKHLGIGDTALIIRMRTLNLIVPREIIEQRIADSRLKKGLIPLNKGMKQVDYMTPEAIAKTISTRFKKGNNNHNTLFDGCITVRDGHVNRPGNKPHKYIRLSKAKWKALQIYNWENVNGPVPKGHILACLDGDTLNCNPSNWEVITKAENATRNSGQLNLKDKYVAGLLARGGKGRAKVDEGLRQKLMEHPDLIELKRKQIILNRTINENAN